MAQGHPAVGCATPLPKFSAAVLHIFNTQFVFSVVANVVGMCAVENTEQRARVHMLHDQMLNEYTIVATHFIHALALRHCPAVVIYQCTIWCHSIHVDMREI